MKIEIKNFNNKMQLDIFQNLSVIEINKSLLNLMYKFQI